MFDKAVPIGDVVAKMSILFRMEIKLNGVLI